jgi:ADP-heptose:LPS heptosyltransferase/glycosyltransferase involved in cell wall biosynthesis
MAKRCIFCLETQSSWDKKQKGYLIVNKTMDNEIHVHGSLDNKDICRELLLEAASHAEVSFAENKKLPSEIMFHNRQRIGDILMFTCAVRDFKKAYPNVKVNVVSTAMHIWDNNPYISRDVVQTEKNLIKIGPSRLTNSSNRLDWHFANAYRVSIEDALKISIPQGVSRPDIWFTREEYEAPRVCKQPYWIIVTGGEKGWGSKMYPFERWQKFVEMNSDVLFYQIGAAGDKHAKLQGANVVDYIGKTEDRNTGVRDLFKLFLNAEGSVGLVSFHMHLSGALYKPSIVVAGAREPVSFTRYPGHQYLATDGCLPCAKNSACWHCDINACKDLVQYPNATLEGDKKVPKCVDMITPEDLTRALNNYYIGGRLKKGVPSEKPKNLNVVEVGETHPTVAPQQIVQAPTKDYGLPFNSGSVTVRDWDFIKQTIEKNNIKSVLEFGAGLSTLLFKDLGLNIRTYETSQGWIDKIKAISPSCDVRLWDGKNLDEKDRFDLAFVDGPSGGGTREMSTKIASEQADIVIVHDASRADELKWQEKYLKGIFRGPGGGGQRCHLWSKNDIEMDFRTGSPLYIKGQKKQVKQESSNLAEGKKFIKIVSTARGWGGCARSITTIMKELLKEGHRVEFIPFRNAVSSREFKQCIDNELKGLIVTESYSTISEKCDVLFMYADDYIWEFNKPEVCSVFENINADSKIMMLNYRRGSVGQAEWTKGWDKYMFLNSTQEQELLKLLPNVKTKILPPCTDLSEFFKVNPSFEDKVKIVRHSSQGDTKFENPGTIAEIMNVLNRDDITISMLPGPSFVTESERFKKFPRTDKPEVLADFLSKGNLFWYSLPKGYMDMGPRVIIEAMAAGLPIIADNWGGAVDRVTSDCGWLCNSKEEMLEVLRTVSLKELKEKGANARERAKTFSIQSWVKEIVE